MKEVLSQLGLSENEAMSYLLLLEEGDLNAAEVAKHIKQTRTNTYMILDRLVREELVQIDESHPIRRYQAVDPVILRQKLQREQKRLQQTNTLLSQSLPKMQSLYNLGRLKPGVVYLEGLDGLNLVLDDMARSREDAIIIPSGDSPNLPEVWDVLQKGVNKRAKLGVKSKIIFPVTLRDTLEFERLQKQGMTIRFWGEREYPGEFVVYGDKCVFTTYKPKVINTILTNTVIADTLRMLFEDIWNKAKP